ncbi:myb/SANT-like DNA-binding domain-containing protein 4, partial [Haliotis asinina]|uniref:myb/SANT-like DNA-binding domain-containing protein 4 n=2 Tax=Haliotis asinina TaxID=109174 RepID=UPI0035326BD7
HRLLPTRNIVCYQLDCPEAMNASKVEGKRRPNWSEEEKTYLVEEVNKRLDRLSSKFKGCGSVKGTKIKEQAWMEIAEALNMKSNLVKRTVEEVKKQYANIKQRAKDKADAIRRPKTGGGPKPSSPSRPEAMVLEELSDRPTLQGLVDGFDSEDFSSVISSMAVEGCLPNGEAHLPINEECGLTSTSIPNCDLPVNVIIDNQGILHVPSTSTTKESKPSKRKLQDEEVSVLRAERDKYIAECEKLKQEANYFKIKAEVEELKKQRLQLEIMKLKCENEY